MTTSDVWKLLYKRYPSNEYAVLQEVRDKAGHHASRSADGLIVNLWPSRGNEIQGLEVKISRSDWLRELKSPEKAENIIKFCDRWWLMAGDETVVLKPEIEIPVTWGYMVVKKNRICIIKEAPKLTPAVMDRSFIAAMMKRATEGMVPRDSIKDEIAAASERSIDYRVRESERKLEQVRTNYKELKEEVDKFEAASGIKIYRRSWGENEKLGNALRYLVDNGVDGTMKKVIQYRNSIEMMMKEMDTVITELKPYSDGEAVHQHRS